MKKSTAFVFRLSRKTKVVGTLMIFIEAFQDLFFYSQFFNHSINSDS